MKPTNKYLLCLILICVILACTEKRKKPNNQCEQKAIFSQVHISIADSVITKNKYATGKLSFAGFKDCFSEEIEVSIKGRGNTSWSFPKRSYQIKFTDTTTFLSLPAGNKFVLIANYSDKSMLRNELAFSLSRLSELNWTPKSQFVELTVNKEYIGVYQLIQKIEIAENALNSNKTDVLLEIDHKERLHPNDIYFETDEHLFCVKGQTKSMEEIKTYIEKAEQSIMFRENYDQFFDLTALADWYIINEIAKNNDALFNSSVYLNFKLGEQIQMGPVWDYDISFGNINYNGNDSIQGFFIKKAAYFEQLFKQTDFVYFYHDYKLISKVQIITPKGDFGIRENYSYFKQSYWLNDIDTILLNDLGDLSKKEKNQIVYDVYQNCDSTVNTIRNRSAHHTSLLKIHELAAQAIGHENRTFSQFNNQKENKLQDIHTFCSDQFNTMIQELEIKQKNKIEEIKKSKIDFYNYLAANKSKIDSSTIADFLLSFNACETDFKSIELILLNSPQVFMDLVNSMTENAFHELFNKLYFLRICTNSNEIKKLLKQTTNQTTRTKLIRKKIKSGKGICI